MGGEHVRHILDEHGAGGQHLVIQVAAHDPLQDPALWTPKGFVRSHKPQRDNKRNNKQEIREKHFLIDQISPSLFAYWL